jgi:hypothetical protein
MKDEQITLENLDVLVQWHMENPELWSKMKFTPSVIENYNNKRSKATDAIWCVGETGYNHLVKNFQRHNPTQQSVIQKQLNFTQNEVKNIMGRVDMNDVFNRPKVNIFKNHVYPDKDWTIQTKIAYYRERGYKVPNRLQPYINKVSLEEEVVVETLNANNNYFDQLFSEKEMFLTDK